MPIETLYKDQRWTQYLGVIAETGYKKGQRKYNVYIPDLSPSHDGDITPEVAEFKSQIENVLTDSTETVKIKVAKTIEAEYAGFDHDMFVPICVKGQQVIVWNFANDDRYFFVPLERDAHLKTFACNGIRVPDIAQVHKAPGENQRDVEGMQAGLTDENTYFIEIDTKFRKRIILSTAASDKERFRHFICLDANDESIELYNYKADDITHGNTIKIECNRDHTPDGDTGKITLENSSSCQVVLDGEDCKFKVPRDMVISVGRNFVTKVGVTRATVVGGTDALLVKGTKTLKVLKNYVKKIVGDDAEQVRNFAMKVDENRTVIVGNANTEHQMTWTTKTAKQTFHTTTGYSLNSLKEIAMVAKGVVTIAAGGTGSFNAKGAVVLGGSSATIVSGTAVVLAAPKPFHVPPHE